MPYVAAHFFKPIFGKAKDNMTAAMTAPAVRCPIFQEKTMAAKTPEENHKLFQDAVGRANIDALIELYEADALMTMPDRELRGHPQLRAFFETWLQAPANVKLEPLRVLTQGDTALEKTRCVSIEADGTQSVSYSTVVLRRQADGQWRIAIDFPMSDSV